LLVEYVPPADQAALAWHFSVFNAGNELALRRAASLAENAIQADARCLMAQCALGLSKLRLGQTDKAWPGIERAYTLNADSPEACLLMGMRRLHEGDQAEAARLLEEASELTRRIAAPSPEVRRLISELRLMLH
jgi:Flp pilus assembly protein TadD